MDTLVKMVCIRMQILVLEPVSHYLTKYRNSFPNHISQCLTNVYEDTL